MYAPKHRRPQRPPRPPVHPPLLPPHPSPHHTNSAPPTPRGLRTLRHQRGPARHRAPDKSVLPNGQHNDKHRNTTRPKGSRDTGRHLPGAEPYPAPQIRGRRAPGPNKPLAPHTRTGSRPRAPQEARNLKHHPARPHTVNGRQPARRQPHRPTRSPTCSMAHLTGRQRAQHMRRLKTPRRRHTLLPRPTPPPPRPQTPCAPAPTTPRGPRPPPPAISGTEDLPAMTYAGPALQRHHALPTRPAARPAEPSSPGGPAPGPDPGSDPARTTAPAGALQPAGPGSLPEPPSVSEGHAREAAQPTNDEAEPPALQTLPQRREPTVGAEEMRGPQQRTATATPMQEPGRGADRPAIQHADPPDIATHGSGEALTACQPDTEPEEPMPDTECGDGLHPPSATGRAGAALLANLAHHADASAPGEAPLQDPPETRAASETREATPARGRQGNATQQTRPRRRLFRCLQGDLHE